MSVEISNGTQTGGAEATLYEPTGDASWLCSVDLSNMVDGDTVVLRAKAPGEGGTYRTFDTWTGLGGQLGGITMTMFGPHTHPDGIRYTLEQPLGTGKDFVWSVFSP